MAKNVFAYSTLVRLVVRVGLNLVEFDLRRARLQLWLDFLTRSWAMTRSRRTS